ncbi:RpoE-regulated lipoprotein [Enterobacteriaceae bacterium ESL0689]|nr:RpoE-regulated lipoprotein [Enterobacteriaceae bacterium ESL0689]
MSLRYLLCCPLLLLLTGCSTLSAINVSAFWPWNWFTSSVVVSDQGVGQLTATTPLSEQAIRDALPGNYRLRRGMKSVNGNIEPYYEALKEGQVMMTIEGHSGTITRITTTDSAVKTAGGVRIGTPFSTLYRRAFGHCRKENHSTTMAIVCQAEGSQHISYVFSGEWHGPQGLLPPDDSLQNWPVSQIIWQR